MFAARCDLCGATVEYSELASHKCPQPTLTELIADLAANEADYRHFQECPNHSEKERHASLYYLGRQINALVARIDGELGI